MHRFQGKQLESVLRKVCYDQYNPLPRVETPTKLLLVHRRVRYLQDLPQPEYRAQQGREPSVLHHLQLVWISSLGRRYQDRFPKPGRPQKACWLNGVVELAGSTDCGGGSYFYLFFMACHLLGLWLMKKRFPGIVSFHCMELEMRERYEG
jgi:hypothetical protein